MLYEMAKRHDEWPGEDYDGSSLRGVIKGWRNMGVCSEDHWPYHPNQPGALTIPAAKDARRTTVGAYYRIQPILSHFHAAICEVGIIAASARVHDGWFEADDGEIPYPRPGTGGHAFAIVGYDDKGFWVQNSWSRSWGKAGLARWAYEDWVENIMDAWVVRLALPTPQVFGLNPKHAYLAHEIAEKSTKKPIVPRAEIAGHFVHIDDGRFAASGRYWSSSDDVQQTAKLVAESSDYQHLLVYAHGGLNAPEASARRIAAMKNGFKRNGVYPFHLMYDTGLVEELMDMIVGKGCAAEERVGGWLTDATDRLLEGLLRRPGTLIWEEMKTDAFDAFDGQGAGVVSLQHFVEAFRGIKKSGGRKAIHLAGHSTGGIVIAHLLKRMQMMDLSIDSCSLLAPASTVELYDSHYVPVLAGKRKLKLKTLNVYTLNEQQELDDTVGPYRKSLLYLVSRAFERVQGKGIRGCPLLGMKLFQSQVDTVNGRVKFFVSSSSKRSFTRSTTHGGFDNDPKTMNHTLKTILGHAPKEPFTADELSY